MTITLSTSFYAALLSRLSLDLCRKPDMLLCMIDLPASSLLNQPRFQAPEKWDWGTSTLNGVKTRFGQPRTKQNFEAVAVLFGGLRDAGEQYFELAHELIARNIRPFFIDLPGQGGSTHFLANPHKRHSQGFEQDLKCLHKIIDENVLSSAVCSENNHKRLPIILLAHSMGGHLALRYLHDYNKTSREQTIFSAAALFAPLLGVKVVENWPDFLIRFAAEFLTLVNGEGYVPCGTNWFEGYKETESVKGLFSSDPERVKLQDAWFSHPEHKHLATGSPTNRWLRDALVSCATINTSSYFSKISTPVLLFLAGADGIVSNAAIRRAAQWLPHAKILEIPAAQHEILMEADEYRQMALDHFFTFLTENVLNGPEKGMTYIL
jgi:lysophospholipase